MIPGKFAAILIFIAGAFLARAQSLTFSQSQWDVTLHPGILHADVAVDVSANTAAFHGSLTVTSDVNWLVPEWDGGAGKIRLHFHNVSLLASQTATVRATTTGGTNEFFVHGNVRVPSIVGLIADPMRSRVYALHANGLEAGSLIALDPIAGRPVISRTLGRKPTDLAVDASANELLVIQSADRNVAVLDPLTLDVRETFSLPEFNDWGVDSTAADIGVGPGRVIYYTDGNWAPVLYVYDRAAGSIRQRLGIDGYGFGDFALSHDQKTLIGWAQYGWSAGWAGSYAARFTVADDGTLTQRETSPSQWPTSMVRDPLDSPVLISSDDHRVFVKQQVFPLDDVSAPSSSFPSTVYAISPGGEVASTAQSLFETSTGNLLLNLTGNPTRQVITPDYSRLVYFDPGTASFKFVDLIAAVGPAILGRTLSPVDGSITLLPDKLQWSPVPGINRYEVYLGSDRAAVAAAVTNSTVHLGSTGSPQFKVPVLEVGQTYYWRIDAVSEFSVVPGEIHSFTVSPIAASATLLRGSTVAGYRSVVASFDVSALTPGVVWRAEGSQPWISFATNRGVTPSRVEVLVDAAQLPVGRHEASVLLGPATGPLASIPLQVRVEALSLTLLKSDPDSAMAYGVSENVGDPVPTAHLIEIDTEAERITRIVDVGASVTDLAIHNPDGRIYVPNWRTGSLLAVNKTNLVVERSYPFAPFGGVGYGGGDVYRVSPGPAGRLVVEEADQWISLYLLDTRTGKLIPGPGVREGGGGTDPSGRYYYHGENNSSGASIQKYDLAGDVFTQQSAIRVESASYYGSRVVTVSADGSRIFWNGSAFDANLKEEWALADHIYACTANGRYAFGKDKIYDINRRQAVFAMPASTVVSAFNTVSDKLIVQQGGRVRFYHFNGDDPSLPAPELKATGVLPTGATLTWTDESLETGFTIQMRPGGSGVWSDLAIISQNTTQFTVSNLSPESGYDFRIKATASTFSSPWSGIVSISTPGIPPSAPAVEFPEVTSRFVRLRWQNPLLATGILVERRAADLFVWTAVALPLDATTYTDTSVVPGNSYVYRVMATNSWASSASAEIGPLAIPLPAPPPSPVLTDFQLLPGLKVRLAWSPNLESDGFEVERRVVGEATWTRISTLPAEALDFIDSPLEARREYQYRLLAFNTIGRSEPTFSATIRIYPIDCIVSDNFGAGSSRSIWSQISGAEVVAGIPGLKDGPALWFGGASIRAATTIPVATQPGTFLEFDFRAGNASDGPNRWDPSEFNEGIRVEYTTDSVVWATLFTLNTAFPNYSTWGRISLPIPVAGPAVQFRWRQERHSGVANDTWALDNVCLLGPVPEPPAAPEFLMVSAATSSALNLFWTSVPLASAYQVERALGASGWSTIASVTQAEHWYRDTNCIASRSYGYRVRAVNAGGASAPSPVSFGTTLGQLEEWQVANWGEAGQDDEAVGPDGLPYLIRFAFNLDASEPARWFGSVPISGGLPRISVDPATGRIEVAFARRKTSMNPGVHYEVQTSTDLIHWETSSGAETYQELNPFWEAVGHRVPDMGGVQIFFRVLVRRTE